MSKSLREQKKHNARAKILRNAEKLMSGDGYDRARMRDIAAAAQVSYQTLYNYFPTKASVAIALLADEAEHLKSKLNAVASNAGTPLLAKLNQCNTLTLDFIANYERALWRSVYVDLLTGDAGNAKGLSPITDQSAPGRLAEILTRAQQSGELERTANIDIMCQTLTALIEQAVTQYLLDAPPQPGGIAKALQERVRQLVSPYLRH